MRKSWKLMGGAAELTGAMKLTSLSWMSYRSLRPLEERLAAACFRFLACKGSRGTLAACMGDAVIT